jgi:hypothetical protein
MKNKEELIKLTLHPRRGEVISEVGQNPYRSFSKLRPYETQLQESTNTTLLPHLICLSTSSNK